MIDTVILRLHNLDKYEDLIRRLELRNKPAYTKSTGKVDPEEVRRLRKMGYSEPKDLIEIMKINRTGEFLVKTKVGKQMNASNHYAFTYFLDWTKGHLEFNFSIPKYKFGSNVLMFVEHVYDRDFRMGDSSTLHHNLKLAPKLFISFIKRFLKREFIEDDIDYKDVEINRVDVCFNQVFRTKQDALIYLDYQKKLKKKYARDEEGVMQEYATSLMYKTKRYSAKIYHKGSEYVHNDLKEHQKINKEKGCQYFDTARFSAFADRILRYELTLRNGMINYLYKQTLFRRDCPFFRMDFKSYTRVDNVMQANDRIAKKAGSLTVAEKAKFLEQNPYEKIDQNDRKTHKYMSKILEKRTFFKLEIDERTFVYNSESVNYACDDAKFTMSLLSLCLKKLVSFIQEFQIKELPAEEVIARKIDKHNSIGRNKLPKGDMLQFYLIWLKHGSFKEVEKHKYYSRATLYRYKSRFKVIGITETNLRPIGNNLIPEAPIDLQEYHSVLVYQNALLRGIRIN